jgi:hypothetical protein
VVPVVREKAEDYLGLETTYEKCLQHQGRPLVYDDREPKATAEGGDGPLAMAASTLWRWISRLGGLGETLHAACELIRQKEPGSTLHRETWPVSVQKYRSEPRRQTLQQALRWMVTERVFARLFDKEIFPGFAIAHGWR